MSNFDDELIALIAAETLIDQSKLSRDATLADIGLDSVGVLSIVFAVEEKYGVEIPDDAYADVANIGQFLDTTSRVIAKTRAA